MRASRLCRYVTLVASSVAGFLEVHDQFKRRWPLDGVVASAHRRTCARRSRQAVGSQAACSWIYRLVHHLRAPLSAAATKENIPLHLQFTVYEERRHPFSDIFSHGLPCGVGES
jgi:hypothetical protein